MRNPLKELCNANSAVEHSIDRLEFEGRSAVSRDVVGYLRHLVEHIQCMQLTAISPSKAIILNYVQLLLKI